MSPGAGLRRDAERNRKLLLQAARSVYSRDGLGAPLEAVAEEAGVSTATAYRHFPNRERLIDSLFEEGQRRVIALAEEALLAEDPWEGLVGLFLGNLEPQEGDRGMRDVLMSSVHGAERLAEGREQLVPLVERLVRRAHDAGALRADVSAGDLAVLSTMLAFEMDYTQSVAPAQWRRHATIILDGLRARPDDPGLPDQPLSNHQLDTAARDWAAGRRPITTGRPSRRRG